MLSDSLKTKLKTGLIHHLRLMIFPNISIRKQSRMHIIILHVHFKDLKLDGPNSKLHVAVHTAVLTQSSCFLLGMSQSRSKLSSCYRPPGYLPVLTHTLNTVQSVRLQTSDGELKGGRSFSILELCSFGAVWTVAVGARSRNLTILHGGGVG